MFNVFRNLKTIEPNQALTGRDKPIINSGKNFPVVFQNFFFEILGPLKRVITRIFRLRYDRTILPSTGYHSFMLLDRYS